ncbi:MAG: hypothetical protein CM15mP62_25500 [Rhodospirillaceae bacterium]|nr:MAG: hypothetical protein CM15mP62_25500 [Rhodospirillaceae bacterium]
MEITTIDSENSRRDISKIISTNDLGDGKSGELVDFEDTSFLLRCSNHFPPKILHSITR